jgi:predicted nucleotidyltransferase
MKIAGIIAEYDPFHNGHAYQINKTKAAGAEAVVAVLSGDFTQRGEPAFCPKELRAKAALRCGADLILELPLPYAIGSAERFAFGGISLLATLHCVGLLSFGSESGDREGILAVSEVLSSPEYAEELKTCLAGGVSMAAAREEAVRKILPEKADLLKNPNDSLGAEYCKWVQKLMPETEILTVRRYGAGHGEMTAAHAGIVSASYLRSFSAPEEMRPYMPEAAYEALAEGVAAGKFPAEPKKLETAMLAKLRTLSEEEFAMLPDCAAEGFFHRVYSAARRAGTLEEFYALAKTKRYAMSRIRRIAAAAFTGADLSVLSIGGPPYCRVLAMNETGAAVLKEAAKCPSGVPIGCSLADLEKTSPEAARFAALESRAEDLYQLSLPEPAPCGAEYRRQVIKE